MEVFYIPLFSAEVYEGRFWNHIFCLGPSTSLWVNQLYFWFLRPFQTQFLLGFFCLFHFFGSTKTWILYFQHNSGQLTSFRGLVSETCGFRSTGYDKESCNKAPPLGLWVRRFGVPNLGSLEFFCTWNVWSCIYNMLDCCMRISICLHICIYIYIHTHTHIGIHGHSDVQNQPLQDHVNRMNSWNRCKHLKYPKCLYTILHGAFWSFQLDVGIKRNPSKKMRMLTIWSFHYSVALIHLADQATKDSSQDLFF